MEKETLQLIEPVDFRNFIHQIDFSENNVIVGETDIGQWKEQIVPSLYFRQNEFFRIDFNSASNGYLLKFISTEINVSFSIEFLDTVFLSHYKIENNKFSLLKLISRSDLTRFEKIGPIKFMAVKAKNSLKMMKGMQGAPVGGLIPGLIFRGAFKLAARAEDDLVEKDGVHFALYFLQGGIEKKLEIIVDSFYGEKFEEILKKHWTTITPPKPIDEDSKGGCFIATACYKDYDHPIVLELREFRDAFLSERNWGKKFIVAYYKFSPKYAKLIEKSDLLKRIVKIILIKPVYFFSKVMKRIS